MPCLWSAWLELAPMLEQREKGPNLLDSLPDHWMKNFFMASYHLEMHQEQEALNLSGALLAAFPTSVYLQNLVAHGQYMAHNYDKSVTQF